jgi:hypothetical protein
MHNLTITVFLDDYFWLDIAKFGIFLKPTVEFIVADMYEIFLRQNGLMMVYIKPKLVT